MDVKKVENFLIMNSKYLPANKIGFLKEKLMEVDDSKLLHLQAMSFNDPQTIMIMSIFLGGLGVDRFMLGDTGMGILKLLTFGGLGILWIMDIVSSQDRAKEKNFQEIITILQQF